MSDFKAKMYKIRFRLGELTALTQTPWLDLRRPLRGREGRERDGEREGEG